MYKNWPAGKNTSGKIHDYTVVCSTVEQLVVGKSIHVVTPIVPSNTVPFVLHLYSDALVLDL